MVGLLMTCLAAVALVRSQTRRGEERRVRNGGRRGGEEGEKWGKEGEKWGKEGRRGV